VLVDGRLGLLRDVKPGSVAVVKWEGGKAAQQFEAFDLSAKSGERLATVERVTRGLVAVTAATGGTTTIHANVRTRVFLDGKLTTRSSIKPGYALVATATTGKGGKPAAELLFLTPS